MPPARRVGDQVMESGEPLSRVRLNVAARPRSILQWQLVRASIRVSVLVLGDVAALGLTGLVLTLGGSLGSFQLVARGTELVFPVPGLSLPAVEVMLGVIAGLAVLGTYGSSDVRRDPSLIARGVSLGLAFPFWSLIWVTVSPAVLLSYLLITMLVAVLSIAVRFSVDALVRSVAPLGAAAARALIVGSPAERMRALRHPAIADRREFAVLGGFNCDTLCGRTAKTAIDRLLRTVRRKHVDTLVYAGHLDSEALARVVDLASVSGCQLLALASPVMAAGVDPHMVVRRGAPLMLLNRPMFRRSQLVYKRMLDIAGSLSLLVLLSPVLMLAGIAVRASSRGPVLFGQDRVGLRGRLFRCLKFRSMDPDAERKLFEDPTLHAMYVAHHFKLPEDLDPRITAVGRFIRRTSLDELPQLWNVLRGEMSLVGPRPIVPLELDHYGDGVVLFTSIKPGMTGAWAVSGRSTVGYPVRADLELDYVRNWSLWRDVGLLLRTVVVVVTGRGAH